MRVLLLGVGMQGKAALHDLVESEAVDEIVAADLDVEGLREHALERRYGTTVGCEALDASDPDSIDHLLARTPDVAIDLLPRSFGSEVATACIRHGVHLVNTNYATPELRALDEQATSRGVTILPEFGMDPGIDLVMGGEAVRSLEEVTGYRSYGAGIPTADAATNPIRYKVSWSLEGVLHAYCRPARLVHEGNLLDLAADEIFLPQNWHKIDIEGVGSLEAYANGDALPYADALGLDRENLHSVGRFTLRWPGHCAWWQTLVDLNMLDDALLTVGGVMIDKKEVLAAMLEPHLQFEEGERDMAILRIEVDGLEGGRPKRVVSQVVDYRDLETGFTGVSRLTGFTASIGAQLLGTEVIAKRGVLSPLTDVPFATLAGALRERGIEVSLEQN
jgi:saccharopine dehydrogenase-like NADP-dependent oxidoreductase